MTLVYRLLAAHVVAVLFGVFSLLVLIPNPQLWTHLPGSQYSYRFAMDYAGPIHMALGAATMVAYGIETLGHRRTAIFTTVALSLAFTFEFLGTTLGWPFGHYAYITGLGYKIGGHVPYSIPLSWFYLSMSAYLLAVHAVRTVAPWAGGLGVLAFGVWLLTAWDLALDPAMAHEAMPMRFWAWRDEGAYHGMPLRNFAGWVLTGTLIMAVSRALWGAEPAREEVPPLVPYAVYVANLGFGILICAGVGMWPPIVFSLLAGVLPASLALWRPEDVPAPA